jgi:SynChlorMet cassette radical SAM/SPASM protein ScmE
MAMMKTPKTLDIAITNRCNLRCLYCYHFGGAGEVGDDLPAREWQQFFEELNRCAVMDVILAGGEPFMRKDLKEIIESIVANRMRFSILSNGTLITEKMADFLASTGRCNHVQVSIDGSNPAVHDACRGRGNFEKAVGGAKRLMAHGIKTAVRVTIHKHNVRDLDNIARLLLEDLQLPSFSTNSAMYMGLCRKNKAMVQMNVGEHILAMESLLRLNKKYDGRISASAGPLSEGRSWLEMEEARLAGKATQPHRGFLAGCNGPDSKMAVRADGVMVPCTQISHIELGRINKDSLKDVWTNHPEMKRLRDRRQIPLGNFSLCRGCSYIPYCTGGCPALAYTITGHDDQPSPDSCLRKFLSEGGRLPKVKGLENVTTTGGQVIHG